MPKLPFSFPDFVKYPLHAVVYILLTYFVYKEFTKTDECSDLRITVTAQGNRIVKLEKDKDDLTWAIAVKSGVVSVQSGIINQLKSQKDSANKEVKHENIN